MSTLLNKILSCGEERFYDIVNVDRNYTNLEREIIDEKSLIERYNNSTELLDFKIADGVLMCNSLHKEVTCSHSEIVKAMGNKEICKAEKGSIYKFLEEGAINGYLFVNLHDDGTIDGMTPFTSLKFSKSTMTVQVHMITDESIYNKVIIHNRGGVLQTNKFHYAVPANKLNVCESDIKMKFTKDDVEYFVYESGDLKLFENEKFIMPAVNQCASASVKMNDALKTMKAFRSALYRKDDGKSWEGGSSSYKNEPSVVFESTCKKLQMRQRNYLVSYALDVIEGRSMSFKEVVMDSMVASGWDTPSAMMSVKMLDMVVSAERSSMFQCLQELIRVLETNTFFLDLFLYRMRVFILLTEYLPVNRNSPYLIGGNTTDFTEVKTKFKGE